MNKAERSALTHAGENQWKGNRGNLHAFNVESRLIGELDSGPQREKSEVAFVQYSNAAILETPE